MLQRSCFYSILLCSLILSACQKEVNIAASDLKALGTSAHNLLSADQYTSLTVEIDYMPGFEPDAASLQHFTTFLNTYINKPDGIKIIKHVIAPSGKTTVSIPELVQLEKQSRSTFTLGTSLAVYILLADAGDMDEADILAVSYWNTSTCLFGKSIAASSGGPGQVSRTKLVTTLLEHEFGHLMGLVDQGSPMQTDHRDHNNGAHCSNPDCLMYFGIETAENIGTENIIADFDNACKADLKANGGK